MAKWIAETSFDCIDRDGRRFCAVARISEPEVVPKQGDRSEFARCAVSLVPLVPERNVGNMDTFRMLCVAIQAIRTTLKAFRASGGQVLYPGTRSHIDLDEPSFLPWIDLAELPRRKRKGSRASSSSVIGKRKQPRPLSKRNAP
jgi:hypothetical protein